MDAYLTRLRQASKPLLDEQKRQGMIVDYKIFLKETKNGPEDWDICLAVQYKNYAAMDGLTAKGKPNFFRCFVGNLLISVISSEVEGRPRHRRVDILPNLKCCSSHPKD